MERLLNSKRLARPERSSMPSFEFNDTRIQPALIVAAGPLDPPVT